jgi:hypothetical protein
MRFPWSRKSATPPVVDLYESILKKADDAPLDRLLTSLSKLAREMKHAPLHKWTALEIKGYGNDNDEMDDSVAVPKHRFVPGERVNDYGQVMILEDARFHFVNQMPLPHGVAELQRLAQRSAPLVLP